jgi:hypothetical protein
MDISKCLKQNSNQIEFTLQQSSKCTNSSVFFGITNERQMKRGKHREVFAEFITENYGSSP